MAVVFISPRQRQKTFFVIITIILLLFIASMYWGVINSSPKEIVETFVLNKPKINMNMSIFDSNQFKNLQTFTKMDLQFMYTTIKDKKQQTNFISASSLEEAKTRLKNSGINANNIKLVEPGRDNPFNQYYPKPIVPPPATTPPPANSGTTPTMPPAGTGI